MSKLFRKTPKVNPITLEFNQLDLLTNKRAFKGPNGELIVECSKCVRKLLPPSFPTSKSESLGIRAICKECSREANRLNIRDRINSSPYKDHEMILSLDHHNMREIKRAKDQGKTQIHNEALSSDDKHFDIHFEFNPELCRIQILLGEEIVCNMINLDSSLDFALLVVAQLRLYKIRLQDTSLYYEAE